MATSKTIPQQFQPTDGGLRLTDNEFIRQAILNLNSCTSTYGIVAAGTTQGTATPLASVLNQIDTVPSNTGVNLPLSTGRHGTPCQFCVIYNNGANPLSVYGFQGSTDTINGVAGSTGQVIPANGVAIFNTAKGGSWFTGDSAGPADFSGNITELLLGTGFVQKAGTNGRAGTFTLNGATTVSVSNTSTAITDFIGLSLNTVGGTVGVQPHVSSITAGNGFTIIGTAGDTSVYNYSMIGIN